MIDIEELERLEQTATPGPWTRIADDEAEIGYVICKMWPHDFTVFYDAVVPHVNRGTGEVLDNMELIVAMRNALPELLADLRRERERNAELNDKLRLAGVTALEVERARASEIETLRTANAELVEALRPIVNRWVDTPVDVTQDEIDEFEHAAEVLRRHEPSQ